MNEGPPEVEATVDMGETEEHDQVSLADCGSRAEVTFTTADEVTLLADFLPADQPGARSIVLLHMIPPRNNRSDYPDDFLESLNDLGWNVLNVDRRGTAGRSDGEAVDAYEGVGGRLDVEAAVSFLLDE
ncbi:MAG: hypothetical protein KC561_12605, partial [Myxococcales bacterium]|nr:hypothetical protein [Myxococcales bacterium]